MINYHKFNFFKQTYCEFEKHDIAFLEDMSTHFKSKSGSSYHYTVNGVYRYSNHWGRVANCRWNIRGIAKYKSQNFYVGYANWSDFYSLNNFDDVFYIEVDDALENACIKRAGAADTGEACTMTFVAAHQRLKQVQRIIKEHKWAAHYDEPLDKLRKQLVTLLITSKTPLQTLKLKLKT